MPGGETFGLGEKSFYNLNFPPIIIAALGSWQFPFGKPKTEIEFDSNYWASKTITITLLKIISYYPN